MNLLRKRIEDFERDVKQTFPGRGKLRADDAEITMMAKATGETIHIGYDNAGDCAHGYILAHRIG